jgi:hypothetical protein
VGWGEAEIPAIPPGPRPATLAVSRCSPCLWGSHEDCTGRDGSACECPCRDGESAALTGTGAPG